MPTNMRAYAIVGSGRQKKNETTRKVNYHEHEHTHYRFARTHPHIAFRGQHSSISVHNGRRQSQS